MPKAEESTARNEAGTPRAIFAVLHREYAFDVDVAAVARNAKLPIYMTPEDDSLSTDWSGTRAWCNPPYRDVPAWLAHAHEPAFVAYLLPVRGDREWWRRWKPLAEVHWFVGEAPHRRLQFEAPPGFKYSSNPDSNCLFLFGEDATPGLEVWRSGLTGERLPVVGSVAKIANVEEGSVKVGKAIDWCEEHGATVVFEAPGRVTVLREDGDHVARATGKDLGAAIEALVASRQAEAMAPAPVATPKALPTCGLCGKREGGSLDWSSLVDGSVHPRCAEEAIEFLRTTGEPPERWPAMLREAAA